MRHGVFVPPLDAFSDPAVVVDLARLAEDRGWDGFFVWDHLMRPETDEVADPWILLAAVACATERIVFGPMVTPLPRRRPQVLAREAATLDRLGGGRLVLGIGLGVDSGRELSAFGEQTDDRVRGDMLDEGLDVLEGLLGGEEVNHMGEHYSVDGVRFLPAVRPPGVPIWLAARTSARRPLERAARYDGAFIIERDPPQITDMLAVVREARGSLEGFEVATVALPEHDPDDFAAAGVTWWMTGPCPGEPVQEVFGYIGDGPPR